MLVISDGLLARRPYLQRRRFDESMSESVVVLEQLPLSNSQSTPPVKSRSIRRVKMIRNGS